MKTELKQIIKRLLTAVLYWLLFVAYYHVAKEVDIIDVVVLFGMSGVFMPYVVSLVVGLYE